MPAIRGGFKGASENFSEGKRAVEAAMRGALLMLAADEGHREPGEGRREGCPRQEREGKKGGNNSSCQKWGGRFAVGPTARPGSPCG